MEIGTTSDFLCGVIDSSLLHSVGFIGFVGGNIAYYNFFSNNYPWIWKYTALIPGVAFSWSTFYLHKEHIPSVTITSLYSLGVILPHILFMRNVFIMREFTK